MQVHVRRFIGQADIVMTVIFNTWEIMVPFFVALIVELGPITKIGKRIRAIVYGLRPPVVNIPLPIGLMSSMGIV